LIDDLLRWATGEGGFFRGPFLEPKGFSMKSRTGKLQAGPLMGVVWLVASFAQAQVTDLKFVLVDNTPGGSTVADVFHTNDLLVSFAGQYTGSQLIVELASGSIYQNSFGNIGPPSPALMPVFPSLAFDSFVAQGNATNGGSFGHPAPGGGAIDMGGDPNARFDTGGINQAWHPAGAQNIIDQVDFFLARVTLSNDATGTANVLVSAAGVLRIERDLPIIGGVIGVPEPGAAVQLGLALWGMAMSGGRRRWAGERRRFL